MAGIVGRLSRVAVIAFVLAFGLTVAVSIPTRTVGTAMAAAGSAYDIRIVGGRPASIEEHPWVVALTMPNGFQFCGGALVAPNKVVTAAHCAQGMTPVNVRVVAGRTDLRTPRGVVTRVASIWTHPGYVTPNRGADVSVLTLDQGLDLATLPVAGPRDGKLYAPGTPAMVFGWGHTTPGGKPSPLLLSASVPVMSDTDCSQSYDSYRPSSMVCAGLPQGGVDACQGDSGGPLVADDKLVGLVSWGDGCAQPGNPGVYTRVISYHDVIEDQLS